MPDTRLGDKRHFSPQRNLFPHSCWGAARALLFAAPASFASAQLPEERHGYPPSPPASSFMQAMSHKALAGLRHPQSTHAAAVVPGIAARQRTG